MTRWTPAHCVITSILATAILVCVVVGCTKAPEGATNLKRVSGTRGLYESYLSDGTRCVTTSTGGIACEWQAPKQIEVVPAP